MDPREGNGAVDATAEMDAAVYGTCATCAAFHAETNECRRQAPQPRRDTSSAFWPQVCDDDWCCEGIWPVLDGNMQ